MALNLGMASTQGIEARFRVAFADFSLEADLRLPGQGVIGFFGQSGCGKTTLLRCMAGLQPNVGGRLVVNGECWQDDERGHCVPTHRRPLGFVFQETNLFPHLNVRRNLAFGMNRVALPQRKVGWDSAIDLLGIGHLLERMPGRLSGGERQRVGIARALLTSPRLLLLDEPLAALDLARKQEILPYLESLRDELSIPVAYVSHSPDEIARLADHIVVMQQGRVLADGPLAETLTRIDLPIRLGEEAGAVLHGVVAERDSTWNLARVEIDGGSLWLRDAGNAVGHHVRVRILARDVSIALAKFDSSIANTIPAVIAEQGADEHPAQLLLRLQVGKDVLLARLTRRSAAHLGLAPGMKVWAQIKAVALL
jgi:molybdate transport system ATP-binding protein